MSYWIFEDRQHKKTKYVQIARSVVVVTTMLSLMDVSTLVRLLEELLRRISASLRFNGAESIGWWMKEG